MTISTIKLCGVTALFGAVLKTNYIFHSSGTEPRCVDSSLTKLTQSVNATTSLKSMKVHETLSFRNTLFHQFTHFLIVRFQFRLQIWNRHKNCHLLVSNSYVHHPSLFYAKFPCFAAVWTSKISRDFHCTPKFTQFINYFIKHNPMVYATLSRGVWGIVDTFFSFYNEISFGCHGLSLTGRGGVLPCPPPR